MHPTANSGALIRKTWMVSRLSARRVMPGVRRFPFMKILNIKLLSLCLAPMLSTNALSLKPRTELNQVAPRGISFTYVSQRWLTKKELAKYKDPLNITVAVKMRLSNRTDQKVLYFASNDGSIIPVCYQATRRIGAKKWKYWPGYALASSDFTSNEYTWLELPPRAVIEFEIENDRERGEEHAFSIFIKTDSSQKPIEVMSNSIRPLRIK